MLFLSWANISPRATIANLDTWDRRFFTWNWYGLFPKWVWNIKEMYTCKSLQYSLCSNWHSILTIICQCDTDLVYHGQHHSVELSIHRVWVVHHQSSDSVHTTTFGFPKRDQINKLSSGYPFTFTLQTWRVLFTNEPPTSHRCSGSCGRPV